MFSVQKPYKRKGLRALFFYKNFIFSLMHSYAKRLVIKCEEKPDLY